MSGITLTQAEAQLAKWIDADTKLALGQTVEMNGRRISHADTTAKIDYWQAWIERLSPAQSVNRRGVAAHRVIVND